MLQSDFNTSVPVKHLEESLANNKFLTEVSFLNKTY